MDFLKHCSHSFPTFLKAIASRINTIAIVTAIASIIHHPLAVVDNPALRLGILDATEDDLFPEYQRIEQL
jgi:hypothetical protein